MKKYLFLITTVILLSACGHNYKKELVKTPVIEKEDSIVKVLEERPQEKKIINFSEEIKTEKKIICIDPGHGVTSEKKMEKVSPKSEILKPAYVAGTKGVNLTEEQLNLILAKKIKILLEKEGFEVLLTRDISEIALSNIERAELANKSGALISVHVHADWSGNPLTHGISVLIPNGDLLIKPEIIEKSKLLGQDILDSTVKITAAKNNGLSPRNDLTGLNWSNIPSIFIETGFMSNKDEDSLLETEEYQNKVAEGISSGIISFVQKNKE